MRRWSILGKKRRIDDHTDPEKLASRTGDEFAKGCRNEFAETDEPLTLDENLHTETEPADFYELTPGNKKKT